MKPCISEVARRGGGMAASPSPKSATDCMFLTFCDETFYDYICITKKS